MNFLNKIIKKGGYNDNINNIVNLKVLDNGMKICLIHQPYNISRAELVVGSGMLAEKNPSEHGYAHILEHLSSFYPSYKYPDSLKNQKLFTKYDIKCNAWTSAFATGYFLEGKGSFLEEILDYMYQHFSNPKWNNDMWNNEINAICNELASVKNDIWSNMRDAINAMDFPGTVFELGIDSEINSVGNAIMDDVLKYREKHYTPNNYILFITTDVNKYGNMVNYNDWNSLKVTGNAFNHEEIILPQIRHKTVFCKANSTDYKMIIGWDIPWKWNDMRTYALEYLSMILTSGLGSLLMIKLRSDEGLIYTIDSGVEVNFYGKSRFHITLNAKKRNLKLVKDIILETVEDICIRDDDMIRKQFSDYMKGEYFKTKGFREYTEEIETQITWNIPINEIKTLKEIHNEISKYNRNDLKQMFIELFNQKETIWYSGCEPILEMNE